MSKKMSKRCSEIEIDSVMIGNNRDWIERSRRKNVDKDV
jgi:hypothetical protein